jgi:hypothetical protein
MEEIHITICFGKIIFKSPPCLDCNFRNLKRINKNKTFPLVEVFLEDNFQNASFSYCKIRNTLRGNFDTLRDLGAIFPTFRHFKGSRSNFDTLLDVQFSIVFSLPYTFLYPIA